MDVLCRCDSNGRGNSRKPADLLPVRIHWRNGVLYSRPWLGRGASLPHRGPYYVM
jgi:hypothetical protein